MEKLEAQALVKDLQRNGAMVTVVRGNVSSFDDVRAAMSKATSPIGGIIQAAMGLDVSHMTG